MVRTKSCIICQKPHTNSMSKTCSPWCQRKHQVNLDAISKEKVKVKKEKAKTKKSLSVTFLKKKLWKLFSEYIRRLYSKSDWMCECVTCWIVKHWKEQQAGHYIPAWSSNYLRFVEANVHPQCYWCNVGKHSNPIEYRLYMEERYGKNFVELLIQQRNEIIKFTPEYLLQKIDEYEGKLITLDMQ